MTLWAALLAAAALCWAITFRSWDDMGNGPGAMGRSLPGFIAFWVVMMSAMMLPSVAPVAGMYLRAIRTASSGLLRLARTGAVVSGYLAAWAGFGLLAYLALVGAERLLDVAPGAGPWVAAAVLAVAGVYQLTPLKEQCLSHCRSPLGFLLHFGSYRGRLRDVRVGAYHGAYCVGCCWGLMAVFVAVGVMNVAWMAALSVVILLEKAWEHGRGFGRLVGVALVVLAFLAPWNPSLVPGLDPDSVAPMEMGTGADGEMPADSGMEMDVEPVAPDDGMGADMEMEMGG